jgi:excisionase family DNA binding protein
MAELASRLQVSRDWIKRRIRNGTISITRDPGTHRFLFPDTDATLAGFNELKAGMVDHLDCAQFANQ